MSWPVRALYLTTLTGVLVVAQSLTWAQSGALEAARAACSADLQQFCAGVQPGGGRMLACLKEHRDQVSPECKQAVKSALQGAGTRAPGVAPAGVAAPASAPATGDEPSSSALSTPGDAALVSRPAGRAPNPIAASTASGEATPSASISSARTQPPATAAGGAARYYQLKRVTAVMKLEPAAGGLPVDAKHEAKIFSLLAPADWNVVGGFTNKADAGSCFSDMIQVSGAVRTSDEAYGMGVAPQSTYRYADDPGIRQQMEQRDRFDEKYKLKGCPIVAPMHAADFIRENLVWKFHKDRPQVTSEPFPELEQLVRAQLGPGSQRVEAARVRTSATSAKGVAIDEWWAGAIVVNPVPVAGRGMAYDWHAEQITVFQTPKGKMDGYDKLYRVMATSVRLDPQLQAWRSSFINKLYTAYAQNLQRQNAIIAAFQQHVIETIQGVTANQQRGSMVAAYGGDQLVRGVQTFRDPSTGRTVELTNLYDHAWSNGNDQYIVSDDPNFNPNGHINGNWGELQPVRPQP